MAGAVRQRQVRRDLGDKVVFSAMDAARLAMVLTDPNRPDNPIVFANQAFLDLTGYPLAEVLGRNLRFLQGPETDPRAVAELHRALAARTPVAVELRNHRRDGTPFWNAVFVSPVHAPDGGLRYFLGTQLDVTRSHEAAESARQAEKLEAVGELTGGVAHDFNNLLTVLAAGLEVLGRRAEAGREQRHAARMAEALERARRLTAQLLAFASRQQLDRRLVELNALAQGFEAAARHHLGPGIALELALHAAPLHARLDVAQVQAALAALLANARDAMPGGGKVELRVGPASYGAAEWVALEVADSGHGMAPEVLVRAPEPFFSTRTARSAQSGLGLGLAAVHGTMRQLRGRLVLESAPGRGTRARLLFPAVPGPEVAPRQGDETLLLVDGDPLFRDTALEALEALGYRVLAATSGAEALAVLQSEPGVALLLTALAMPGGMTGPALAEQARRLRPALKVLVAAGPGEASPAAGLPLLAKPLRPAELADRVRATLDG